MTAASNTIIRTPRTNSVLCITSIVPYASWLIAHRQRSSYDNYDSYETPLIGQSYRETIVSTALALVGVARVRYQTGRPDLGQSPETGFDCSGFVRFVLLSAGLHVPDYIGVDDVRRPIRHASEFWDHYGAAAHPARRRPGDLIVFSRSGWLPTHIGIMVSLDRYAHAPGDNEQVRVDDLHETPIDIPPHRQDSALYVSNPIGYKAPVIPHPEPTYRNHQIILS